MIKIIYNKLSLIFFFICFLHNTIIFTSDYIVIFVNNYIYKNKSEQELVNEYIEELKKNWPVDQYITLFKDDSFVESLIKRLSKLSLSEVAKLPCYFSPLLSEYIINYIENLDNSEEQKKYILLLLNCDSRLLCNSYKENKEKNIADHYAPLVLGALKKLRIGDGVFNFSRVSSIMLSALIKHIKELSEEDRNECSYLILILIGSLELTSALVTIRHPRTYNFSDNFFIDLDCVNHHSKFYNFNIIASIKSLLLVLKNISINDLFNIWEFIVYCMKNRRTLTYERLLNNIENPYSQDIENSCCILLQTIRLETLYRLTRIDITNEEIFSHILSYPVDWTESDFLTQLLRAEIKIMRSEIIEYLGIPTAEIDRVFPNFRDKSLCCYRQILCCDRYKALSEVKEKKEFGLGHEYFLRKCRLNFSLGLCLEGGFCFWIGAKQSGLHLKKILHVCGLSQIILGVSLFTISKLRRDPKDNIKCESSYQDFKKKYDATIFHKNKSLLFQKIKEKKEREIELEEILNN